MRKTYVIMFLFLILLSCLCCSTIGTGFASVQIGVSPGDTFYYNVSGFGTFSKAAVFETRYLKVTIEGTRGSHVWMLYVLHYKNDTEITLRNDRDLDSAGSNFTEGKEYLDQTGFLTPWTVVAANLNPNDPIFPYLSELCINETVMKSYSGVMRETNIFTRNSTQVPTPYYYVYDSAIFDKTTGALVEYYYEEATSQGKSGYSISLTQSNKWVVPEFPSYLVLPLLMTIVAVGALLYRKKLGKLSLECL